MANCPSCGCRTAEAARFCPMCGVTINQDAANARQNIESGAPHRAEVPQPNERLLECYVTPNSCGTGLAKAMRVIAALLVILLGVGSVAGGIIMLTGGEAAGGILVMVLGIVAALLLWFMLYIGIVIFENISAAARGAETQNRIATAQLELISNIVRTQEESLRLERQTVELLKLIDGERFDAAKQAECQTALLDKLVEQQKEQAERLSELKGSSDALNRLAISHVQSMQSWKSEHHRFIHGVALAISQLPDRLRDVLAGRTAEQAEGEEEQPEQLPEAEGILMEDAPDTSEASDAQNNQL